MNCVPLNPLLVLENMFIVEWNMAAYNVYAHNGFILNCQIQILVSLPLGKTHLLAIRKKSGWDPKSLHKVCKIL